MQGGQYLVDKQLGTAQTPVFPGEVTVPVLPPHRIDIQIFRFARQAKITDRDNALALPIGAVAIGKGIKLLDITYGVMRLGFHPGAQGGLRSEEHTSELQSLMRISYAVFCLKKKNNITKNITEHI